METYEIWLDMPYEHGYVITDCTCVLRVIAWWRFEELESKDAYRPFPIEIFSFPFFFPSSISYTFSITSIITLYDVIPLKNFKSAIKRRKEMNSIESNTSGHNWIGLSTGNYLAPFTSDCDLPAGWARLYSQPVPFRDASRRNAQGSHSSFNLEEFLSLLRCMRIR